MNGADLIKEMRFEQRLEGSERVNRIDRERQRRDKGGILRARS